MFVHIYIDLILTGHTHQGTCIIRDEGGQVMSCVVLLGTNCVLRGACISLARYVVMNVSYLCPWHNLSVISEMTNMSVFV